MSGVVSTVLFGLAILHIFAAPLFLRRASRYSKGSISEKLFHLLGEVELVFAIWAVVFLLYLAIAGSISESWQYLSTRNFTEPLFVFVIMVVCATKPVLVLIEKILSRSRRDEVAFFVIMIAGPLLGSLITEPAAMTVCALLLIPRFYQRTEDLGFKYAMTGLLFVNISIGGTLTSFAAPPVLMVAGTWNWDSLFMLKQFGWKAVIAIAISTTWVFVLHRKAISNLIAANDAGEVRANSAPSWLTALQLLFIAAIVFFGHQPIIFLGLFAGAVLITFATRNHQNPLQIKEGLLVGLFLAGLVVLGGPQGWWLEPLLARLSNLPLFLGAAGLTALMDNAALTYLGSLVPGLSEASKYALVAGAVTGGGLTVIANAPNPAGYGILNGAGVFGEGFSAWRLFVGALIPTLIAGFCFWWL